MSFHFYADDSQPYTSFACNDTSDLVAAKHRLENFVADISLWMTANKLKLNNDKSEFLFLHSRFRHLLPPPTISFGMENIRPSKSTTEILIHSFVSSKLDFCNSLLFGAQKRDIAKLQSVQNAAA